MYQDASAETAAFRQRLVLELFYARQSETALAAYLI